LTRYCDELEDEDSILRSEDANIVLENDGDEEYNPEEEQGKEAYCDDGSDDDYAIEEESVSIADLD
jgi:hypothetical protein